jgi:hypothetical protein
MQLFEGILLNGLLGAILVSGMSGMANAEDVPVLEPDSQGAFFILGKEDGYRYGYRTSGWSLVDEHACIIGVDCHSKPFPSHLRTASGSMEWADTAVERVTITFQFGEGYDDVILRLVRAGAETIVVRLDDRDEINVTKSMMVPRTYEHSEFGAHDLMLGHLEAGMHTLQLSVAEDGEGNSRFGWDSIQLLTRSR